MPTYRIKHTRTEPPNGLTSLYTAIEEGTVLLVAVIETPVLFTVFDNKGGQVPFPENLVCTGDKLRGVILLQVRYGISYTTPRIKEKLT